MVLPIPTNICPACKGRGDIEFMDTIAICSICKGKGEITQNGEDD